MPTPTSQTTTTTRPECYEISQGKLTLRVTNHGAKVMALTVPDRCGNAVDVALGYDTAIEFVNGNPYFGATIGRVGNRIKAGSFKIPGEKGTKAEIQLPSINNGPNHLHGGPNGFNNVYWSVKAQSASSICFEYVSPDGEEGYPGNVRATVTYALEDTATPSRSSASTGKLRIIYSAMTDKTCPINLTNHTFFNLNADHNEAVLNHELQIDSDGFLPIDNTAVPLGYIQSLNETKYKAFDFRSFKCIGVNIDDEEEDDQIKAGCGYDHTYVIRGAYGDLRRAATLRNPKNGIVMETFTTERGMQLYTGNWLGPEEPKGKNGIQYKRRSAVCLETQSYPDGVNQFPEYHNEVFLRPGAERKSETCYEFSVN